MNLPIDQSASLPASSSSAASATDSPAYMYSAAEKIRLAFASARQRWFPQENLFAGPYAGEFGPELMQFQGYVRARRRYYRQVHVLTYPGREYLYEGCHVHAHNIDLKSAGYWYGKLNPAEAAAAARMKAAELGLRNYDIFNTSLLCTQYHKRLFWPQEFRLLEEPPLVKKPYDVVFHFRAVRKVGPDPLKNYPPTLADELAQRCIARGLSVACVGHPDYSYCATGCDDHRYADLQKTVAAISSGRAGVGEASGGMHIVNACGKPSIIWGEGQWRIDPALNWNPFRVPIYVVSNAAWQPAPEDVCRATVKALEDLRVRTNGFTRPAYTLPAQPIGYF
jgi:hypothetical protein